MLYRLLLILGLVVMGFSCTKDSNTNCSDLKEGMIASDYAMVKKVVDGYINRLPSKKYTAENLDKLAAAISKQCDVDVEVLCFDCIKTLPAQSEIKLSFNSSLSKTLDLSIDVNTDNMKILNMHN